jgi:hypothetical protein
MHPFQSWLRAATTAAVLLTALLATQSLMNPRADDQPIAYQPPGKQDEQDPKKPKRAQQQPPPPAGIVPLPNNAPPEGRRNNSRRPSDRPRPSLQDLLRQLPPPPAQPMVPQQPGRQGVNRPSTVAPLRPSVAPNVLPPAVPPQSTGPPVPSLEHIRSLTPDQRRELVRIAIGALSSELEQLSTAAQWSEYLRQQELESIVDCDEYHSDVARLDELIAACRRSSSAWTHAPADNPPQRARGAGAPRTADRDQLQHLADAIRTADGAADAVDSLNHDIEALRRIARRMQHRTPAADVPENDDLSRPYLAGDGATRQRADAAVLIRMAERASRAAGGDEPDTTRRGELNAAPDALRRLASRLEDGAELPDHDCGSVEEPETRARLRDIADRFQNVAANPGYRQISGLWGFRTLQAALPEYALSRGERDRRDLAASAQSLDVELGRLSTGRGWKDYLQLDALTRSSTGQDSLSPAGQQQLIGLADTFEQVAIDNRYTAITDLPSFGRVHIELQQAAADARRDRITQVREPHINLPGGAWLYHMSGTEFKLTTDVEIDPNGQVQTKTFHWNATTVPLARGVVWQVGRVTFMPFTASEEDIFVHGLARAGDGAGQTGSFNVDFGALVRNLGLVTAAANPPAGEFAPFAFLEQDVGPLQSVFAPLSPAGGLKGAFFDAGGSIVFHVRAVPVVSPGSSVPAGQPTNTIRVFYGKAPTRTPTFRFLSDDELDMQVPERAPPSLRVFSFKYEPMKTYCIAHRDKIDCGTYRGEGRQGFDAFLEDLAGAFNFASKFYQEIKSAVVSAVGGALNAALALIDDDLQIPESVLSAALDSALLAAGIPPSIPDLNDLLEQNADLLAARIAEEAGVPGPLTDMAREKIKQGLIDAARAAERTLIRDDGEGTPCEYHTDPHYFLVGIENTGPSECVNIVLNIRGDSFECPFATSGKSIASLKPGERLVLPMHMPRSQHERFLDGAFYDDGAWYQAYATEAFEVGVTAVSYYTVEPWEVHSMEPLYGSGKRVWNVPLEEQR